MEEFGVKTGILSIIVSLLVSWVFYVHVRSLICDGREMGDSVKKFIKKTAWLHPNAICVERVVLAFTGIVVYFGDVSAEIGIFLFTFSAMLDGVDGLVARECGLITENGEWLDPLADKLTYLPVLFLFSYSGLVSAFPLRVFLAIEFFGQFIARKILAKHHASIAATWPGKIKASVAFGLIIFCAAVQEIVPTGSAWVALVSDTAIWSCVVLGIVSIVSKFVPLWNK